MAKLSSKKKANTTPVEEAQVTEEVVEAVQEDKEPVMTEAEKEAIQKVEEDKAKKSADTRRLQLATNVVSGQFNLDPSYSVSKFDDKGKVVNLTLENGDFIITVCVKDSDRHGLSVE